MTNPSDSELVAPEVKAMTNARIAKFLRVLVMAIRSGGKVIPNENSAEVMEEAASRLEAADTIDRLTSSGEAVAWRWRWKDQLEADGWCLSETDPRPGSTPTRMERFGEVQPLYTSPREGHVEVPVEPTEVLWIAFSMEYAVEGYENFAKAYRTMLSVASPTQAS